MKPDAGKPLLVRTIRAFGYAFRGLAMASRDRMFRVQAVAAIAVVALACVLRLSATEWALLVLTIGGVLALETMNTALEAVVDLVSPEPHPLAGRAKDVAAGAVLIASIASVTIGAIVLGPHVWHAIAR